MYFVQALEAERCDGDADHGGDAGKLFQIVRCGDGRASLRYALARTPCSTLSQH